MSFKGDSSCYVENKIYKAKEEVEYSWKDTTNMRSG